MLCELKASAITNLIYGTLIVLIICAILYTYAPLLFINLIDQAGGRIFIGLSMLYIGRVAFDMTLLHFNNKCVQPKDTQSKTV